MIAARVQRASAIARAQGAAPSSTLLQTWVADKVASARGLPGFAVPDNSAAFSAARAALVDGWDPTPDDVGLVHEVWVTHSGVRRARGAHYTPRAVAEAVVARTLAPLEGPLRVADLSCGGGAFLLAALRWATTRGAPIELFGVDVDGDAVHASRLALCLELGAPDAPGVKVIAGDALLPGSPPAGELDAVVGNPPWVSYAGRAAQPLSARDRARYGAFAAFAGYRNLQGLFVERGAEVLRPGGRLGLVLPTSMSDLSGYAPSRRAHDAWCVVDDPLIDLADGGFEGVFQPCMALTSTRRPTRLACQADASWPLLRSDLDATTAAFLARVAALPKLPPTLFGERGYQSLPADKRSMRDHAFDGSVALLTGTEVRPFERLAATTHADPRVLAQRLRSSDEYREIDVLIRQTARFPMAALSNGGAFRNSVLAGFGDLYFSPGFLVAWLNAWSVRAFHYLAHRDARQGMPQLKIGHLRALPAPVVPDLVGVISSLGARLGGVNRGVSVAEQRALDQVVADALKMNEEDRGVVERVRVLVGGPG